MADPKPLSKEERKRLRLLIAGGTFTVGEDYKFCDGLNRALATIDQMESIAEENRKSFQQVEKWRVAGVQRQQDLVEALKDCYCKCHCKTHGFGCGLQESTCRQDTTCKRCKALRGIDPGYVVMQLEPEDKLNG